MYGQMLGRTPVGVTKDAGVQIGVRKTVAMKKEQIWNILTSPPGLSLWIGNVSEFELRKGYEFQSAMSKNGPAISVMHCTHLRQRAEFFSCDQLIILKPL